MKQHATLIPSILMGLSHLRFAASHMKQSDQFCISIRVDCDIIFECLVGSHPSIDGAIKRWDKIKMSIQGALCDCDSGLADDLLFALAATDESFIVLASQLEDAHEQTR